MEAVEFDAAVEDGMIRVPAHYLEHLRGSVRVILLTKGKRLEGKDLIGELLERPRKVEGFTPLTRDEIYERSAQ